MWRNPDGSYVEMSLLKKYIEYLQNSFMVGYLINRYMRLYEKLQQMYRERLQVNLSLRSINKSVDDGEKENLLEMQETI